jgi:hypothetical protein
LLAALIVGPPVGFVWEQFLPKVPRSYTQTDQTNDRSVHAAQVSRAELSNEIIAHYTRSLDVFTGALVFVGFIGFGVSCVQIFFLRKADDRAAEAGTVAVQQIQLARDEFNATNRPKLVVRNVTFMLTGMATNPIGQSVVVSYELANIGGTPAIVVATEMSINYLNSGVLSMASAPNIGDFAMPGQNIRLKAGEFRDKCWYGNMEARFDSEMVQEPEDERFGLFFCGHILYVDDGKTVRRTTFCRRYDAKRGYWPVAEYYDYDHAD